MGFEQDTYEINETDNETLTVLLSTTDLDVSLEPSSASVTIVDNDSKIVLWPLFSCVLLL